MGFDFRGVGFEGANRHPPPLRRGATAPPPPGWRPDPRGRTRPAADGVEFHVRGDLIRWELIGDGLVQYAVNGAFCPPVVAVEFFLNGRSQRPGPHLRVDCGGLFRVYGLNTFQAGEGHGAKRGPRFKKLTPDRQGSERPKVPGSGGERLGAPGSAAKCRAVTRRLPTTVRGLGVRVACRATL